MLKFKSPRTILINEAGLLHNPCDNLLYLYNAIAVMKAVYFLCSSAMGIL